MRQIGMRKVIYKNNAKIFSVGGFYSYVVDQTDLLFPRNSGLKMRLYRVENVAALKAKLWTQSTEVKCEDLVMDAKTSLNAIYSSLAPTWVNYR